MCSRFKNHEGKLPSVTAPSETALMFVRATRADVNGEKATRLTTELKAETSRIEASTSASRAEVSSNSFTRKRAYPEACSKSTIDTDMMNLATQRGLTITKDTDTGYLTKWSKFFGLVFVLRASASGVAATRGKSEPKQ